MSYTAEPKQQDTNIKVPLISKIAYGICTVQFWFSFTRIGRCFNLYKSYYHRFTAINFAKPS